MNDPVVVIGGGLAGLAAAARLAKIGHSVELFEQTDRLGGRWAPRTLSTGTVVDEAPAVLGFPAPWRDLFRKSGRPLEAELARLGYELAPAGPAVVVFADGAELTWPADRAGQLDTLTTAYGRTVAESWRDLVDRLDQVWQTLRPLGWEAELRGRAQLALRSTPPAARAANPGPPGPLVAASPPGSPGAQRRLPAGLHPRADPGLGRGRVVAAAHLRPLAAAAPGPGRRRATWAVHRSWSRHWRLGSSCAGSPCAPGARSRRSA